MKFAAVLGVIAATIAIANAATIRCMCYLVYLRKFN